MKARKGRVDEAVFGSFVTNKNEAKSSPILAKMVVRVWLADGREGPGEDGDPLQHRQARFQAWFCCGDPERPRATQKARVN